MKRNPGKHARHVRATRRRVARSLGYKSGKVTDWAKEAYQTRSTQKRRAVRGGPGPKRNPTKAEKKAAAQKAAVERRVAAALAKFLKQANPAMKTAGAKLQRLKGGVIKITPIKANAAGRKDYRSLASAQKAMDRLRAKGIYDAGIVYDAATRMYRLLWKDSK